MRKEIRDEILKAFEKELKAMVRNLLENLMREERAMYLETHPTSANGYYTRDLLTLAGPLEDLKVPRVREGDFHPQILPYRRRASLELSEAILTLYAVGVSTRKGTSPASWKGCKELSTHPKASPASFRSPRKRSRPGGKGP